MGNKVFKIPRIIKGNLLTGNVTHPLSYSGVSLSLTIREIHALFPSNLAGQTAIFMVNTNQTEIANIACGVRTSVEQSSNWIYYSSATITPDGDCRAQVDISQIGTFAIAAVCPVTNVGSVIDITF